MWGALAPRQRVQLSTDGAAGGRAGAGAWGAGPSPANGEPQFAQKRPLDGLPVPQRVQRFSADGAKLSGGAAGRGGSTRVPPRAKPPCGPAAGGAAAGAADASGGAAFKRFPQSWQNLRPSGLSRPQRLQFTTSWPLLPFALNPALRRRDATRPGPLRQQDRCRGQTVGATPSGPEGGGRSFACPTSAKSGREPR